MRGYWLFLPVLLAAACVSTGQFKVQQAEAESQQKRAEAAEAKAAGLQKDIDAAKIAGAQATEAGQKIQLDLQKSNKDLKETLDASKGELSKKVSDLIKQRDALTSQLNVAEADKKALEKAKETELAKVKQSYEDLTAGLKSEISAGQVTITQLKGKLTVNMVDKILFDSGAAEVKSEGRKVLDKLGTVLNGVADKDIRIEGHTDNKPIVGELKSKYPTNWELSTARATAVARFLQDVAKVDGKRLIAAGYGEFHPIASNDAPEGRAQNRRIEIVLVPRE